MAGYLDGYEKWHSLYGILECGCKMYFYSSANLCAACKDTPHPK